MLIEAVNPRAMGAGRSPNKKMERQHLPPPEKIDNDAKNHQNVTELYEKFQKFLEA